MFQIGEIVGIAQEIKNDEISARQSVEQVSYDISNLEYERDDLENTRDALEDALDDAYNDTDEDGEPDRGRIAALQARIAQVEQHINYVENKISQKRHDWNVYKKQLEATETKKEKIIYEIEERARKTSNNIHVSGGIYGAYSGVCTTIQSSLQSNMNTLSQAAGILGTNLSSYGVTGGSSGGTQSNGNNDSFLTGLRNAVVSDEEAAANGGSYNSDTNVNSSNNEIAELQRDIPTYEIEERVKFHGFIGKIRTKIGKGFKNSNDLFVEIEDNNTTYNEASEMREQLIDLVNDGLPINPTYVNKSSVINDDDDDDIMASKGLTISNKQQYIKDKEKKKDVLELISSSMYNINNVKGMTIKYGNKTSYKIEVVKDRFIPQKDIKLLSGTRQTIRTVQYVEDGSKARIFDHPEELKKKLPYTQGINDRNMEGTCGLANLGVWLQIAGSLYKEKDVVNCAATNIKEDGRFLCSEEGGTLPEWRAQVWSMFGMEANVYKRGEVSDSELIDKIALAVESGRAVSVGLNAGKLWSRNNPEHYDFGRGEDNAFGDGGSNHVVGIVSCVRDYDTGEITHFYINDTGRNLERDACRKVSIEDFKKAFCVERGSACISQCAVW